MTNKIPTIIRSEVGSFGSCSPGLTATCLNSDNSSQTQGDRSKYLDREQEQIDCRFEVFVVRLHRANDISSINAENRPPAAYAKMSASSEGNVTAEGTSQIDIRFAGFAGFGMPI
jgi:hypothetical protein